MSSINMETIGRIVLLVLGTLLTAGGFLWAYRRNELRAYAVLAITLLFIGLGTFGLPFMEPYSGLLRTLIGAPGAESYRNFLTGIANKSVPPEDRAAGLAFMLENPISELGPLLDTAIKTAPAGMDPVAKQALMQAKESFDHKTATAEQIESALQKTGTLGPEALSRFDRTTRIYVADSLLRRSNQELQMLNLSKLQLEQMKAIPNK
jgi:hypothetical protein